MRTKLLSLSALLAASMLIGGTIDAQAQNANRIYPKTVKSFKSSPGVKTSLEKPDDYPDMPATISYYSVDSDTDTLYMYYKEIFEYDKDGRISKMDEVDPIYEYYMRTFKKYNEYGRCIKNDYYDSDPSFENMSYLANEEYAYDKLVKDYSISYIYYENIAEDLDSEPIWQLQYRDTTIIERDDQDRVTYSGIKKWKPAENDFVTVKSIKCYYGEGIGPNKVVITNSDINETEIVSTYENIEWKKCENQILDEELWKESMTSGENLMLSNIVNINNGYAHKNWYVYDDADRLIEKKKAIWRPDGNNSISHITTYEYDDEQRTTTQTTYMGNDLDGNGIVDDNEFVGNVKEVSKFDEKGRLVIQQTFYIENGEWVLTNNYETIYIEDEKGRVVEKVNKSFYNDGWNLSGKLVYTYDDTATGIASVNRDNVDLRVNGNIVSFGTADGRYMVSNADGRLVMSGSAADGWVSLESLPAGLYIVKVNGEAVKVIR